MYKEMGIVQSFETILENVFAPLFEVSVDPSSHPQLHVLLSMVGQKQNQTPSVMRLFVYILVRFLQLDTICFCRVLVEIT